MHLLIISVKHTLAEAVRSVVIKEQDPWHSEYDIEVSEEIKNECEFWIAWMAHLNGVRLHHELYDFDLVCDASDKIAAGYASSHTTHTIMHNSVRKKDSTFRAVWCTEFDQCANSRIKK